jgi:hypothetical protein
MAWYTVGAPHWQRTPLERARPDLREEMRSPPQRVRKTLPARAARIVELGRVTMATRSRDLDAFAYGDPRRVHIVEDRQGLAFALVGHDRGAPQAEAETYGALTLRNGVPIGYMDLCGRRHAGRDRVQHIFDVP